MAAFQSINFITGQQTIKHLDVLLGYDMQAAPHQQVPGIYDVVSDKVRPSGDVEDRLELQLHLSATCPVLLFYHLLFLKRGFPMIL